MAARLSRDWEQMYGHPVYFAESFVDTERFRGTCYRAANWVLLTLARPSEILCCNSDGRTFGMPCLGRIITQFRNF